MKTFKIIAPTNRQTKELLNVCLIVFNSLKFYTLSLYMYYVICSDFLSIKYSVRMRRDSIIIFNVLFSSFALNRNGFYLCSIVLAIKFSISITCNTIIFDMKDKRKSRIMKKMKQKENKSL